MLSKTLFYGSAPGWWRKGLRQGAFALRVRIHSQLGVGVTEKEMGFA